MTRKINRHTRRKYLFYTKQIKLSPTNLQSSNIIGSHEVATCSGNRDKFITLRYLLWQKLGQNSVLYLST